MSRRLVLRTKRIESGVQVAIFADENANVCEIALTRGVEQLGEIRIPGSLMFEVHLGVEAAAKDLRRNWKATLRAERLPGGSTKP